MPTMARSFMRCDQPRPVAGTAKGDKAMAYADAYRLATDAWGRIEAAKTDAERVYWEAEYRRLRTIEQSLRPASVVAMDEQIDRAFRTLPE